MLLPSQEVAIRDAYHAGAKVLALAQAYGVTLRTIYRTLKREPRPVAEVVLAGYRAVFEITPEGPVQLTPWYVDNPGG